MAFDYRYYIIVLIFSICLLCLRVCAGLSCGGGPADPVRTGPEETAGGRGGAGKQKQRKDTGENMQSNLASSDCAVKDMLSLKVLYTLGKYMQVYICPVS